MWIVELALKRPYTFIVGALLVVLFGVLSLFRMPTDIFPEIDIPVVSVIWSYNGLPPEEMERRFSTPFERAVTTTVNNVEHIESQSLAGVNVIKIFFQQGAEVESAVAQLAAVSQSILRIMPPGASAPFIIRYNAANVPVLQLALGGDSLSEQELADLGTNGIRTRLATVRGASVPSPYGGRSRVINVDLDPEQLMARGISPTDVSDAVNAQNLVLPSGTAKIGEREYTVRLNGSPDAVEALNDLPIRTVNGALIRIRDVAQVRDGYAVQTNIVHRDGVRGALVTVLKSGGASTIDVVKRVREALPGILSTLPSALKVDLLADQSLFVKAALNGVLFEAAVAACLTAFLILLFLGSWRATLIVALSIPLSILVSITVLAALGQTINVMTLGGLALAVGVLVDDATVGIENIYRVLAHESDIEKAILEGAGQIAVPTLVSTLAICIVFVPIFFLSGVAGSLFAPLAMAVVFAMLASYVISRTLVPTLVRYALEKERRNREAAHGVETPGAFTRAHHRFEAWFEQQRLQYRDALSRALHHPTKVFVSFGLVVVFAGGLVPFLGQDFFPVVDAGQIRLHLRAPIGTRVEETARLVAEVEARIRKIIPPADLGTMLDNVGISTSSSTNLAFSDNPTTGVTDADILIVLNDERVGNVDAYRREMRSMMRADYPQVAFFFQAADIVGQILNFGLPAPINVQVVGSNKVKNFEIAQFLERRLRNVPGAVDVYLQQRTAGPELFVSIDRARASGMALTEREIASDLLVSLSSSGQTAPNVWLNPQNGVQYSVNVQTPQYRVASLEALGRTPLLGAAGGTTQMLNNLATITRRSGVAVVSHYDVAPVFDIFANVQDRDLGGVAREMETVLDSLRRDLPRGTTLAIRGQVASMWTSYTGLAVGLVFAILLVYLVMVVNFQSWLDPFIISCAIPGALAGIVWALFACGNTITVPAFMGAIMSMGVATANSILVVSFANERMAAGRTALEAALDAASTRLRPVIMTALAMLVGMLPMALGFGEGGEQNAPLGRAVIGGLTFATVATLFVVPIVYSRLRRAPRTV
ncbi:efflux RND transporter permease subunit [Gemmatimonas groenlandica]|uniref:Efflux RND transporter permease subunit n=1 Tax=Gemmatimonas groenlandica TaxID=2732249 RepID=A0A6M4INS5_9BACT|nr:efflux RND transporter permease subunit [Gemmatimonas groenlandica]QJR34632.1 efflux RND transporter permease subunit [Gemmatimonas groenlandica]